MIRKFIRFKRDFRYDYLVSPRGFDYQSMTKDEAKEHFEWFLKNAENRVEYLKRFCKDSCLLDYSYESLVPLWELFLNRSHIEKIPKRKLKELKAQYEAFGDDFAATHQLSVSTEYLIRDIGIYLAEIFKRTSDDIYWRLADKPKTYFFVNRPMLAGFVDENYDPTYQCEMDPIHMVRIQALKVIDKTASKRDLYDLAMKWRKMTN